jgi:ribonuclease R
MKTARVSVQGIAIDSADTRDADDAIWISDDNRLFITIANVARYVRKGNDHDTFARSRVASSYYPGHVDYMLPRGITERMGLTRDESRKTLTLEIIGGSEPKIQSIYRSDVTAHRVTYEQVPTILNDTTHPLHEQLKLQRALALMLLERRRANGALALYDLNNGWVTTEEGYLKEISHRDATVGYVIVQEMMVLANHVLAEYAIQNEIPLLFRIHRALSAAPDRAELMRQLETASQIPLENLPALRQNVHVLLAKAEYSASALQHYGLNLPYYLHFTSPIRRYADLVNHQQIHAFTQKIALPYSKDELEVVAHEINERILNAQKERSEKAKATAEHKATRAIQKESWLNALNAADIERVVKVAVRSKDPLDQKALDKYLRTNIGTVPLVCLETILFEGQETWRDMQAFVIAFLVEHPYHAVSLLIMAEQKGHYFEVDYVSFQVFTGFCGEAKASDGTKETAWGSSVKEAQQRAAIRLIALVCKVEPPSWSPPVECGNHWVTGAAAIEAQEAKNPISSLMERGQKVGYMPSFEFRSSGQAHVPSFDCVCIFGEAVTKGKGATKQEAKKEAALTMLQQLGT